MTSPISVLLAGVIVIILLLASSGANTGAITRRQNGTPTWTPCGAGDNECIDIQDEATANAATATKTASGYPAGTSSAYLPPGQRTSVVTGTSTITSTTGTPAAGGTLTPTGGTPTLTRSANPGGSTALPSEVTQPDEAIATLSPTPIDAFTCTPGVPIEIAGDGPPRAPLLLYFGERSVGGGSVAANGRFALKLIVGQERAGDYTVTVRVRGTSQVLRQVTCSVPNVTPTPLPSASGR
jgi:hypothetical protein